MTEAWGALHIEVRDDEIIVTLPATRYTVTYYKPANSPQLLGKNFPMQDDGRVPMTQADFLSRAWRLANAKARELGWIA
jgi:hypothetical protein